MGCAMKSWEPLNYELIVKTRLYLNLLVTEAVSLWKVLNTLLF